MSTAKEVAINLIKAYVRRGDSISSLKSGGMGMSTTIGSAAIGGWTEEKSYSSDFIVVTRIGDYHNGTKVNSIFRLQEIYDYIYDEINTKQLSLL